MLFRDELRILGEDLNPVVSERLGFVCRPNAKACTSYYE